MQNLHIDYQGSALDYQSAGRIAKDAARGNQMQDPTIMACHQQGRRDMLPYFDGANPDTWWEKYGAGNGGTLEISVGNDYQFIMMDADSYETMGEMPLRNISDRQGNEYFCYKPMLEKSSKTPNQEACILLDGWFADQY